MRVPIIAGNWKMYKTLEESVRFVRDLTLRLQMIKGVESVVCPPFIALGGVADALMGTDIKVGAQNMHWEARGAFTGEVAASMLKEFCSYVIIGHSERRTYFGETNETVNRRVGAALKAGLTPIVCVGETLDQYESGQTAEVVRRQIKEGLAGIDSAEAAKLIVAYEPVWAIGTGKASSGENANQVHQQVIRPALGEIFG